MRLRQTNRFSQAYRFLDRPLFNQAPLHRHLDSHGVPRGCRCVDLWVSGSRYLAWTGASCNDGAWLRPWLQRRRPPALHVPAGRAASGTVWLMRRGTQPKDFVQIGRVCLINYGPNEGKLCTVLDIIDQNTVRAWHTALPLPADAQPYRPSSMAPRSSPASPARS
jgi:hypothetical protein